MAPKGGGGRGGGGGGRGGSGASIDFDVQWIYVIADAVALVSILSYFFCYFSLVRKIAPLIWSAFGMIVLYSIDIPTVALNLTSGELPEGWAVAVAFADAFYVFATMLALQAIYDVYSKGIGTRVIKLAWFGWWGVNWLVGLLYILLRFIYAGFQVSLEKGSWSSDSTKWKVYNAVINAASRVWTTFSIFVLLSLLLLWVLSIKAKSALTAEERKNTAIWAQLSLFLIFLINVVHSEVTKRLPTDDIFSKEFRDWTIARACINAILYITFYAMFYKTYKLQHAIANGQAPQPVEQKPETSQENIPMYAGQNTYYQPQTDPQQQQYTYPAPQNGAYSPVPQQAPQQPYPQQQQAQQSYGVPISH